MLNEPFLDARETCWIEVICGGMFKRMKFNFKISITLILMAFFSACTNESSETSESVQLARVESEYLTLHEAREQIPDFALKQDSIKMLQQFREQWIDQQLLLHKAYDLDLLQQQKIQKRLEDARNEVLTSALREVILTRFKQNNEISNEEALRYYNIYKDQFQLKERYIRFRHLSAEDITFARTARQQLQAGTPWSEIADSYSTSSEQRIRQSEKFWPESSVLSDLPVMKRYITTLDSGEISPIRRNRNMYHFVQLTGARAAGEYSKPEWIMDRLKEWIMLEKQHRFYNSFLKNLYLKALSDNEIEVSNVLIPNNNRKPDSVEIN